MMEMKVGCKIQVKEGKMKRHRGGKGLMKTKSYRLMKEELSAAGLSFMTRNAVMCFKHNGGNHWLQDPA